jgi:hypothetical protein
MRRAEKRAMLLAVGLIGMVAMPLGARDFASLYGLVRLVGATMAAAEGPGEAPQVGAAAPAAPRDLDERAEFNRICGQVKAAAGLSVEQIQRLIEDCETLLAALRRSSDPQAKVLIKRLEMCRDFFEFSLEARREPPS